MSARWIVTGSRPSTSSGSELGARRVVDGDRAAEVARLRRSEHRLELATPCATPEAAGDQDRVLRSGHPEPLELVDDRGDRLLAWVDRRSGKWEAAVARRRSSHARRA